MNNTDLLDRVAIASGKKIMSSATDWIVTLDLRPDTLSAVRSLTSDVQAAFVNTYNRRKLDRGFGQLFAVFGVHYAYMRKPLNQILFCMTLGGAGIWYVYDLFTIQDKIINENDYYALEALAAVKVF